MRVASSDNHPPVLILTNEIQYHSVYMNSKETKLIRDQLCHAMRGDQSHLEFAAAIKDFPPESRGHKPANAPHTAWQLLEHLRIAQWDILEFSKDSKHKSPKWPEGYWPTTEAPPSSDAWDISVKAFESDLRQMEDLVQDESQDLFKTIEHGDGQTLLQEALTLADHNSYHLGQLVYLKKILLG
jgi:hypothetical protein